MQTPSMLSWPALIRQLLALSLFLSFAAASTAGENNPAHSSGSGETGDACTLVEVDFFGLSMQFCIPACLSNAGPLPGKNEYNLCTGEAASRALAAFTGALREARRRNSLSEADMLQVLDLIGREVACEPSVRTTVLWTMVKGLGYRAALLFDEIPLLYVAYEEIIPGIKYVDFNGVRMYRESFVESPSVSNTVRILETNPDGRVLSRFGPGLPGIPILSASRSLSFTWKNKRIDIELEYDMNLARYLGSLPILPAGYYQTGIMSPLLRGSLHAQLKPLLEGLSEYEAAALLLHFVQEAFPYKTDDEQFGREKWMMPDEFIHYPYADCEDRAMFFNTLVLELLGLEVLLLHYRDHAGAAVSFNNRQAGGNFLFKDRVYHYCEASGKGFAPGNLPDDVSGERPVVEWHSEGKFSPSGRFLSME